MLRDDFAFDLPDELIAQEPAPVRDQARLMVLRRQALAIEHHRFYELPELLPPNSAIVINDVKVVNSRIRISDPENRSRELVILEHIENRRWRCQIQDDWRPANGLTYRIENTAGSGTIERHIEDDIWMTLIETDRPLETIFERYGQPPLPPYIKTKTNLKRYQTIYARHEGAVAAPTAGLHFSDKTFTSLAEKGIPVIPLTMMVGYGTFAQVKENNLLRHRMHPERYRIGAGSADLLNLTRNEGRLIIAVGTSSTRVLESQSHSEQFKESAGETSLFIHPPFAFKIIGGLITNFHTPRSTPLMLTAAFAGYEFIRTAYRIAIEQKYRFYSFGDAMLIL